MSRGRRRGGSGGVSTRLFRPAVYFLEVFPPISLKCIVHILALQTSGGDIEQQTSRVSRVVRAAADGVRTNAREDARLDAKHNTAPATLFDLLLCPHSTRRHRFDTVD